MRYRVLICLALLSSCEEPEVMNSGYVVGKQFVPAHTKHRLIGKTHYTSHIPDKWFIYVADSTKIERFQVTEKRFLKLKEGQYLKKVYNK
ncbi:hypothetical protein [Bergeyella cardium]|uniref:Uncharacterized protein n=1 Tax=Bergeyella cardium TaxID=1585976 RepID=A0A6P1QUY0_9FLAO|nr:hypothetical protein [Bergeyella cardium]QHN64863.1 hypothetical protein DBX24_02620 [Bergeyella cardium]WHE34172.1 hypothetical protein P8603_02640 [Bergeyella cardium]WHF60823.1 hypothetical protein O0R51_02635 [Bergeyella cardium]